MLLVKNIAKIVGVDESGRLRVKGRDMNVLGEIDNAWLLADGDRIAAYGTMDKMPAVRTPILACSVGSFFSSGYKENVASFFIKSPSVTGPALEYLYL